jgi:signal transduction histidine kinase
MGHADTCHMPAQVTLPAASAELESSLLGVLLTANSVREGTAAILDVISPMLAESPVAIAIRDRDGLTLHVLAESGALQRWPEKLEPQFAIGGQPGVDSGSGTMVVPLRAHGRVVGALLFGDAAISAEFLHAGQLSGAVDTIAQVIHALVSRSDGALRLRAEGLRSIEAILEGMAHQIANPLTGASAIAQLLVEDLQGEDSRAAVRQIQHELSRAFVVLHDLLEFQRDTGAQDGILDLNTVAERIVRFRGYAIREQGITLQLDTVPGFMPVRVDARALEHAMLVALRYAELQSHGTVNRCITVRVVDRGSKDIAIELTDSGLGQIPELTTSYFDIPFRVGRPARDLSDHAPDLGLVDSLLRTAGGSLQVTGSKTDGTTLALVLPRASSTPNSQSRNPA